MSTVALDDLRAAVCSNGAPSARNLIVTVFGDSLSLRGPDTEISVRHLARLLDSFGVNERLVRTSLSRLVQDGLLAARQAGGRSWYRVAPDSVDLFAEADDRIYRGATTVWDGSWTIVVVDGNEGTSAQRARLRQELAWAGLGVVAPNVMASPVVDPATAAAVVSRAGGVEHVLVSRSQVVEAVGTLGAEELARRSAPLDEAAERYRAFVARFERFEPSWVAGLDPETSFKLRTLLVGAFRRIVLADPLLPAELLPAEWIGDRARVVAARVYALAAAASERFVGDTTGWPPIDPPTDRFTVPGATR